MIGLSGVLWKARFFIQMNWIDNEMYFNRIFLNLYKRRSKRHDSFTKGIEARLSFISLSFYSLAEGFPNMLPQAESKKLIHELKFSNNMSIIHLLFAEDGTYSQGLKLKTILSWSTFFTVIQLSQAKSSTMKNLLYFLIKKHSS